MTLPASKGIARFLRNLAGRIDHEGSPERPKRPRKPKWSHPCHVCNARGYVAPHPGQHVVVYAPAPKAAPGMPQPQPPAR